LESKSKGKLESRSHSTKNDKLIVQKEGHSTKTHSTKICPVCGEPGIPVDRTPNPKYPHLVYKYFEHAVKLPSGRWGAKYCYVGRVTHSTKSAESATSASSHSTKNIVQKLDKHQLIVQTHSTKNEQLIEQKDDVSKAGPPGGPTHSTNFCTMNDVDSVDQSVVDDVEIKVGHYVKSLQISARPKWSFNPFLKQWFSERVLGRALHLCCGLTNFPFAVNIDIDVKSKADIIADMFHLPLRSNIFDTIICDPPYRLAIHKRSDWVYEMKRVIRNRPGNRILLKTDFIPFFGKEWKLKELEIYTGKRWWVPISLLLHYNMDLKPQYRLDTFLSKKEKGYTTLGDMKRLGIITSDLNPEELDELEEESLTRIKKHLDEKVGLVFYRCECGARINQVDLFLKYKGKCPKCGKQIVKKEG